jgi:ATP-dependent Lhr-like helicase
VSVAGPLGLFHPLVARWFAERLGEPTEVQARSWPAIAAGRHVLVSAPTGTGKTLAAFLWGVDRLVRGDLATGTVRILYVSPLKALNNDVRENLVAPLRELAAVFARAGEPFPVLRVETRSGDTPPSDRRRMTKRPPEILITTPESLNLLLSSQGGRSMLGGVAAVILDEIHAVAPTKRGTHLVTAVERLVQLAGEFQRIALSATVRPLAAVADLVAGFQILPGPSGSTYRKRRVEVIDCPMAKRLEIEVRFPPAAGPPPAAPSSAGHASTAPGAAPDDELWRSLARECRAIIARNRSTLFFVNSRRHAERVARFINEDAGAVIAWAHHGSLSREMRLVVERRLKRGELSAIVATSSLELGIDIGALDEVVLVGSPFTVASAVQRLGRSGHRVGAASRAVLFALHGRDLVDAAVLARCVVAGEVEEAAPVVAPLDVLAQVLVSMTGVETWRVDELYDAVRASLPFQGLPRRQFDLVLAMLAGRYAETRLRELAPMVALDAVGGTVGARAGALRRLYANGGTIPDRGSFGLRAAGSGALIGELDEEFVWERSVGDTFVFGTQAWRIQRIGHQDVEVVPAEGRTGMSPFWKAEEVNRRPHLALRVASALEMWNGRLGDPDLPRELARENRLDAGAAEALVAYLRRQREATGRDLPHRHHVLVEHVRDPRGRGAPAQGGGGDARSTSGEPTRGAPGGCVVVIHTLWGGAVNKPFGLALRAAWQERFGWAPELFQDNDAILLLLSDDIEARELTGLVTSENLERFLRKGLEASGFFGARFRENAGRALLLPRTSGARRMPLWLTRERAKNLSEAAARFDDFPMLLETWRTCLRDEFDLVTLDGLLAEMAAGEIRVGECSTPAPSPFCSGVLWRETNALMYEDDSPRTAGGTSLSGDLVREIVLSADLRPRVDASLAAELAARLGRTAEGWSPRGGVELLEWLKERVAIPAGAWDELLAACERDHGIPIAELLAALADRIGERTFGVPGAGVPVVVAREMLPRIERTLAGGGDELAGVVAEWLRASGPIAPDRLSAVFGLAPDRAEAVLRDLVDEEEVVVDRLLSGTDEVQVCDRRNLESLLRLARTRARPRGEPLPADRLPLFLALRQGLVAGGGIEEADPRDRLPAALERLFGFVLPVRLWEEEVLPARVRGYRARMLDELAASSGLGWFGCGRQRIGIAFPEDFELYVERIARTAAARGGTVDAGDERDAVAAGVAVAAMEGGGEGEGGTQADDPGMLERIFPDPAGRFGFWDLAGASRMGSAELSDRLWDLAWAGAVSNDSFDVLRRGIQDRFRAVSLARGDGSRTGRRPRLRRAGFSRWQASRPAAGLWYRTDRPGAGGGDLVDAEELRRDRVRQLAVRYGVLFRELLENEVAPLRWPALFRTMRLMELSGELVTGRFFDGVPGPQFALPGIAAELAGLTAGADPAFQPVWWMNACDPGSLCGVAVPGLKGTLPARLPTTHVVYRGTSVALVSRRRGRDLEFRIGIDDPALDRCLAFIRDLVGRDVRSPSALHVETVNGVPAPQSPYRAALLAFGFVEDYRRLVFRASA